MHQIRSAPDPAGGAHSAPPVPKQGPTSKGEGGRSGGERRREEGRGREREEWRSGYAPAPASQNLTSKTQIFMLHVNITSTQCREK